MTEGKRNHKQAFSEVNIFTVPYALKEIKEGVSISLNTPTKTFDEKIVSQAINLHLKGNISEAKKYYQHLINQGCNDHRVLSNYGIILRNIGKSKEAELAYRKAIEHNPDFAEAHYNLGSILKDFGKLEEAELSLRRAIALKPELLNAYTTLGKVLKDLEELS